MSTSGRFLSFESSGIETGTVQQITAFSPSLGRRGDISVFSTSSNRPDDELPLIILLHGVYGSHWAWTRKGNAHTITQALVDAGSIGPCVIAMPSDGLFGVGSGYVANGAEDASGWITRDVPDAVRMVYPGAGETRISIAGLSMGGFGALNLLAQHPDIFDRAAALSPLTTIDAIADFTHFPQQSPATRSGRPPLVAALSAVEQTKPRIWLGCGLDDSLLRSNRALHEDLDAAAVPHIYTESVGQHDWDYWAGHLPEVLKFLS